MPDRPPQLDPSVVEQFVAASHGDLETVRRLLSEEPELVNAAWDWGAGDWETGLGAAAHIGRRDIAELLLEHGARMDVFAAAMLGELEIVQAMLAAHSAFRDAPGPHGIALIAHAQAGREDARAVVAFLESVPAAT